MSREHDNKYTMTKFVCDILLGLIAVIFFTIVWINKANAWTPPIQAWTPEGAVVSFTYYDVICRPSDQVVAMEEVINYVVDFLNQHDRADTTYVYKGRVDSSSYGNWITEYPELDEIEFRIECNYNGAMQGTYGRGVPIRINGDLVGGGAQINQGNMPNNDVLKVVTIHEIAHMLGIKHSYYYDSLMRPATRDDADTPYKSVFRQDTLCALNEVIPNMLWPVTTPVVRSDASIFVPRLSWQGLNFETWLIPENGMYRPTDVKQVNGCADIED